MWFFQKTAIALGSSAIVKVSGQNCDRIAFGLSMVLWGRSVLSLQKVPRKVPSRFHQGLRKFRFSPGLLGQIRFGVRKGSVEGAPIPSLTLSPSLLFAFFLNRVSFGVFSHSKGLAAKWHVCLLGFFAANGFRLPKGSLECSPNSSLHWPHGLLRFSWQAVASEKVLWRVPPTILYIYLLVSSWGQRCVNCWHVSPIQIQSAENDPSCRCCWGILWVYFFLPLWRYQQRRKLQDENKSKTDIRNEKHYINSMDNRKIFWSKHMVKGQELSSCFLYSTLIMYPFMAMIWSLAWSSSIRRYFASSSFYAYGAKQAPSHRWQR